MDKAAEPFTAHHDHLTAGDPWHLVRARRSQLESLMWPLAVVVLDELDQDALQLPATEDQQVVEALAPDGPYPALRERVRARRSVGQADDLDALAAEDVVEADRELGVSIVKQKPGRERALLELPGQVASLLRTSARRRSSDWRRERRASRRRRRSV